MDNSSGKRISLHSWLEPFNEDFYHIWRRLGLRLRCSEPAACEAEWRLHYMGYNAMRETQSHCFFCFLILIRLAVERAAEDGRKRMWKQLKKFIVKLFLLLTFEDGLCVEVVINNGKWFLCIIRMLISKICIIFRYSTLYHFK